MAKDMAVAVFDTMKTFYGGAGLPGRVKLSDALANTSVESNGAGIIKLEDDEELVCKVYRALPRAPMT